MDMNLNVTYLLLWNDSEAENNSEIAVKRMEERKQHFVNSAAFFCVVLFVAVMSRELLKKFHFPHTILLFVFGVVLGFLDHHFESFREYTSFAKQHILIQLFLPVIIYDYAFEMNSYMFMMVIPQCMILALPGFVFCASLNAIFAKTVFTMYKWDWTTCILFGTILCATDPSAIIDLLKDYGVSSSLTTIIEGESLLNNGIALVLSSCMMKAHDGAHDTAHDTFESVALDFVVSCCGAVAIGYVVGMVTVTLLKRCESDTDMEVTCTLCISYITYFVNELFVGVSGLLSLVVLGVSVSSYKSSVTYAEEDTTLHQFWQTLSFWANSLIFTTVGLIITSSAFNELEYSDIGLIIATYFTISVIRGCMISLLSPFLRTRGYGFPTEYGAVLTWAGMRGAVGLGLALMTRYTTVQGMQNKLFIQVSGVIVLTLIFNASTMRSLLKVLGIGEVTIENMESMAHAVALLRDAANTTENATRMDKYYVGADWAWVRKVTHIENLYETQGNVYPTTFKLKFDAFRGHCKECHAEIRVQPNTEEMKKLETESRLLIMRALETSVANQYEEYGILRRTFGLLNNCIENTLDTSNKYLMTEDVKMKLLSVNYYFKLIKKHMMAALQKIYAKHRGNTAKARLRAEALDGTAFRKWCARAYLSERLDQIIFLVLLLNLLPIAGEYTILFTEYRLFRHSHSNQEKILLYEILNAILALCYVLDALIRICAISFQSYFHSKGNVLDFVVTLVSALQMFYGIPLMTIYHDSHSNDALYVLVVWSSIRLIRLLRLTFNLVFKNMVNQCCSIFYDAFDLAMGFIVANEEVAKSAYKIVEFEDCAEFARFTALNNVHEMLCYANEIEEEHPYVVCAWRTHRASIYILKNMKAIIEDMEDIHMLDETDAEHLIEEVSSKMREILTSCRYITSAQTVQNCLESVPWIKNEEVLSKVTEVSSLQTFPKGEIIQEAEKKHTCLRVLYKGIVQITGRHRDEKSNILPNTDSLELFDSVGNFLHSINSPETLGLLGYLLQTPCVTEAISSKDSQLITIDFQAISDIEREFGDLSFHMWKQISIHIAYTILSQEHAFENWSEEKLKIHLEEGIFPDLTNASKFDVNPVIADVVLIQGRVKSKTANIEFYGPAFIPHSVRSLILPDNPKRRPRVVMLLLREEKYHAPATMGWVQPDDITHKGLCLLHGIRRATLHDAQVQSGNSSRRQTFLQTMGLIFKPKGGNILGSDAP